MIQLLESRVLRLNEILDNLPREKKYTREQKCLVPGTWRATVNGPRDNGWQRSIFSSTASTTAYCRQNTTHLSGTRRIGRLAVANTGSSLTTDSTSWDKLVEKPPAYVGSQDAMRHDTVWAVYGLEITRSTILHCGNEPSCQILLPPWLPTKTRTVQFPTQIWS